MNLPFKLNLRFKLFSILMVSLLIGLIAVGTVLYYQFQSFLYNQIKNDLQKYVGLAEASLNSRAIIKKDSPYLKHYVDTIGNILNSRITIIDINGRVLADSEIPTEELDEVENHIKRPEVQQSLKDKFGFRIRHSATIDKDLLYMSKLIRIDQEKVGFLRIALFAEDTDQMLGQVQTYFIGGGVLVFVISTLLVILLSRRFNRNLTEVIKKARQISDGDLQVKIQVDSNDELNELGAALNEMSAELSRYLRKLALERQDLNTVLSSIHEGIIAITPKKKIIFFNTIALQQLNCPEEKIIRKYYYHVIRNQHLLSLIDNFFAKQLLVSDEIQTDSGHTLEVVINPLNIEEAQTKGAVIVLRDITQYKRLEKIRTDFVANVSHEFKTPLAAIQGYSETLLDWGLGEPNISRKYVEKIIKQSQQLENLVSDLLQLAKIERLQNIKLIAFDPNPIIMDVINEYSQIARSKNINLTTGLNSDHAQILGDPEMFRSIMANLIDNAIKYTHNGGKVRVYSQINGNHEVFSVEDTGSGIPQKEQGRIFERFYRVDKARSRSIGGTGLGLSIVKNLSELQNAQVWVRSQENEGSCFSVKFRLADLPKMAK